MPQHFTHPLLVAAIVGILAALFPPPLSADSHAERPSWAKTDWMAHDTTRLVQEASRYSQFYEYDEAYKRLIVAARRGYPIAQAQIGFYYQEGLAVDQDSIEAVKWYLLSGNETAKHYAEKLAETMTSEAYAEAERRVTAWEPILE